MKCNGKCFLMKKIKEQEKQDQKTPTTNNERVNISPFFVPNPFTLTAKSIEVKMDFIIKDDLALFSFPHFIFRPPIA